jgi:hypothetical protein
LSADEFLLTTLERGAYIPRAEGSLEFVTVSLLTARSAVSN